MSQSNPMKMPASFDLLSMVKTKADKGLMHNGCNKCCNDCPCKGEKNKALAKQQDNAKGEQDAT